MSVSRPAHPSPRRRIHGFLAILGANVVLGVPAYFVSFLIAYGFEDNVGLADHLTFLALIAAFAVVTGLIGTALVPDPRRPGNRHTAGGVLVSLALNAAVVGAGSIVSAQHKAENSVSAGFSTTTDVLVAAALFAAAVGLVAAALRSE